MATNVYFTLAYGAFEKVGNLNF